MVGLPGPEWASCLHEKLWQDRLLSISRIEFFLHSKEIAQHPRVSG